MDRKVHKDKEIKKWWIRKIKIQLEHVNQNPIRKCKSKSKLKMKIKDHSKIVQKRPKLKNGGFKKNKNPINVNKN